MNIELTFNSDKEQQEFLDEIEKDKKVIIAGIEYLIESCSSGFFGNVYLRLKRIG
jgi:hypothetical protein